jgi:ribosomal protein L2
VGADLGSQLAERTSEDAGAGTAADRRKSRNEVKGGWSYILAPEGLRAGDVVVSYRSGIPHGIVDGWDNLAPSTASPGSTDPAAPQSVSEPSATPESSTSRALGLLRTLTLKPGNVLPLYLIPAGTSIHNISMNATGRMQLCRSAGSYAQVVAHHGPGGEALGGAAILNMGGVAGPDGKITPKNGSVLVKLQSGEVRRLDPGCAATIGVVSK